MRAILDASLFTQNRIQDLALLECFALARDGRHVILYRSDLDPQVERWISTQSENLRQELRDVIDDSVRRNAGMSAHTNAITIIAGDTSDWCSARLSLPDAARLLREPLHILLESSINDLAFLRRLAPTAYKNELERALARGWAIADNAGGRDYIKSVIEQLNEINDASQGRFQRLRYWVMFDRDSDEDDRSKPAKKNAELATKLAEQHPNDPWTISVYCLERRAIENYLPTQALRRWVQGRPYEKDACEALERLRINRHSAARQYNMKHGLLGDNDSRKKELEKRRKELRKDLPKLAQEFTETHCDKLFHGIDPLDRAALAYGIYQHIADLYKDDQDADFDKEFQAEYVRGGHEMSREAILESLLQRL